jgi:hypothetical protein
MADLGDAQWVHDGPPPTGPDGPHTCTLPEPLRGKTWTCPDCQARWEVLWESEWVYDGDPGLLSWYQVVEAPDVQARADEVTQIMHELGHEEIDPAVIHALMGCATHAIVTISNMVYASHGPDAAGQIMGGWNLFVEVVHPYYLTEPCQHHSWDQPGEPPVPH